MVKTYREVFGEWDLKENGPKKSYRADICSWNQVSINDNMGISRLEKKTVMGIYHKFKSLNVEMSQCQNQVRSVLMWLLGVMWSCLAGRPKFRSLSAELL